MFKACPNDKSIFPEPASFFPTLNCEIKSNNDNIV